MPRSRHCGAKSSLTGASPVFDICRLFIHIYSHNRNIGIFSDLHHLRLRIEAFKVDKIRRSYYLSHAPPKGTLNSVFSQLITKLKEETLKSGDSWIPEKSDQVLVEHIKDLHTKIMLEDRADGVTEEDMREALLRTLTQNLTAEGTPAPPEWPSMFTVLINGPAFLPTDFEFNMPETGVNERAWAYVEPYVKAYRRVNLGSRKLFVSEKGRLGTTSRYASRQHNIYIIPGCRMPIIIDSITNFDPLNPLGARTLGPAYLHGCMHGEAMADLDKGVSSLQTFNLH